ncbi:MAG: prephenate dehydrogenase/arogenate dehydrogenase family protein, partial [Porticoccaceae bacterium]
MVENRINAKPIINRLVVIGLGLIGSSLALAVRESGLAQRVIGISRRASTVEIALERGIIDSGEEHLQSIAADLGAGDMVVIGVPTLSVSAVLQDCANFLSDEVTITDVASVKGSVIDAAKSIYGQVPAQLVPGHPIAGS